MKPDNLSSDTGAHAFATGEVFSTASVAECERAAWLREVIGREYANVEITPPKEGSLFNEMTIYPWREMRLSAIRSSAIAIERRRSEPLSTHQDAYFAVLLLRGAYRLEQGGREAILRPGDFTIYDAARPHRIDCSKRFAKLIISIPRHILRQRLVGADSCTARRIAGDLGTGAVAASFIRSVARHAPRINAAQFHKLSEQGLDLIASAAATVRPSGAALVNSHALSLLRAKDFIERDLSNSDLNPHRIAAHSKLSVRSINYLFASEGTSLMRYVLGRRLEKCRNDILAPSQAGRRISEIAFRWGFSDLSHFSRSFKERFGVAPRDFR